MLLSFLFWFIKEQNMPKPLSALNGQECEICGDEVGMTADGDLFVAYNECGFPVCRTCYEYERKEGSQLCPQCKTRYKCLKVKKKKKKMKKQFAFNRQSIRATLVYQKELLCLLQ